MAQYHLDQYYSLYLFILNNILSLMSEETILVLAFVDDVL